MKPQFQRILIERWLLVTEVFCVCYAYGSTASLQLCHDLQCNPKISRMLDFANKSTCQARNHVSTIFPYAFDFILIYVESVYNLSHLLSQMLSLVWHLLFLVLYRIERGTLSIDLYSLYNLVSFDF